MYNRATGERTCEECGCWYHPQEDRFATASYCGHCREEMDMKVEEMSFSKRRSS